MENITLWKWLAVIIVILVIFIYVPLYIGGPDGLEAVFETYHFTPAEASWVGFFPDYTFPGIYQPWISTVLAGILGTLIVFGVAYGLGKLMSLSSRDRKG